MAFVFLHLAFALHLSGLWDGTVHLLHSLWEYKYGEYCFQTCIPVDKALDAFPTCIY